MKTSWFLPGIVIGLLTAPSAFPQVIVPNPLSPRTTTYRIEADLDTASRRVNGEMTLTWKNPSRDTVGELQLHLYLNAFKNTQSTFMLHKTPQFGREEEWGYIDLAEVREEGGPNRKEHLSYIQPDEKAATNQLVRMGEEPLETDLYARDQTVAILPLEKPVMPDSTVTVKIRFSSKLPRINFRTGYSQDYYFVAQWFPKLGVYEPVGMRYASRGGWNTHQFHPNSEFYANHSLYEVDLTVPESYVVGSGGKLMKESRTEGRKTLSYRAEDIVDFAWTASRDFLIIEEQWKHVTIKVMLQPEHINQAKRHLDAVKYALEYLDQHVGPYPWPYLTVVDPPRYGQASGGMEYTTLITAGTTYLLPPQIRMPEMVTVHEFGHAYFMGILASNEFEEPWLDEGINTYWEARIMNWAYGIKSAMVAFPFLHVGDIEYARISWLSSNYPHLMPAFNTSWAFPRGTYGISVYQKAAIMLHTLENLIGQPCMDQIFRRYYERWAFRHPCSRDFIAVVNEVVREVHGTRFGDNLEWYFDQFLYGSAPVDYAVDNIGVRKVYQKGGWYDQGQSRKFIDSGPMEGRYRSVVQLSRKGDGILPVTIRVRFDSGEEIIEPWDGKDKVRDLVYERPDRVVTATVDPENNILLDTNFLNNSFTLKPSRGPALKWGERFLFLVQNMIHSLSLFI